MDIVSQDQQLTIGKYQCRAVISTTWWWCSNETSRSTNEDIFTQFGLTKKDIWNVLGYESPGGFPQCKSAKDLTKVIEFIMSKDPANQVKKVEVEDYTGRTIRALIDSPEGTTVKVGEKIKILKRSNEARKYRLDKTATGYVGMVIQRPLNPTHWELLEDSSVVNMEAIQIECIKRFPIGCKYLLPGDTQENILEEDDKTYTVFFSNHMVYAHRSGGSLYKDGVYATLVSLPEEKSSIPEYVEYIDTKHKREIVKVLDWSASSYCKVEFSKGMTEQPFKHLVKPSTKAEYEAQFTKKFKVDDYVISDYSYLTLPRHRVSQVLEVSDVGRIKLKEGEFNPNDFRLAAPGEIHRRLTEKIEYPMYAYVGDPLPTIKTKPLIENMQSVSVNLRTKKNNNKFKF